MKQNIDSVREFWSNNPCGSNTTEATERIEYFREIEQYRYKVIKHIPHIAAFENYKGLKVLEIGAGIGTDGRQFAKSGAIYTGINLDSGSTKLAHEGFRLMNLNGELIQMNAEEME
ncbi:MAG: class I SAM-dependent methyltransferase, partial [Candidatus Subteraquimicrobiales bacterium]|nr:class I SAM-dependent methyltransferase [Candidatus Subteraquimicrobiales bacterium]